MLIFLKLKASHSFTVGGLFFVVSKNKSFSGKLYTSFTDNHGAIGIEFLIVGKINELFIRGNLKTTEKCI